MDIIISNNSNKPIYEQITLEIKGLIMTGDLKTGDSIPSMRSLAKSLHIGVKTVQRAYEDLQKDGFIETTVGSGSYVSANNIKLIREESIKQIEDHLQEASEIAKTNGITFEEISDMLLSNYKEIKDE